MKFFFFNWNRSTILPVSTELKPPLTLNHYTQKIPCMMLEIYVLA